MTAIPPLTPERALQMAASSTPLGYRARGAVGRIVIYSLDSGAEVKSISLDEIQYLRLRGRGWVRELMEGVEAMALASGAAIPAEEPPVAEEFVAVPVAAEPAPVSSKKTAKRRANVSVVVGD